MNNMRRSTSRTFKLLAGLGLLGLIWAGAAPRAVAGDAPPSAGGRLAGPASQPAGPARQPDGPAAGQAVLYEQMSAQGLDWVASQDFSTDSYDARGADDFFASVTAPAWSIQTVEVVGGYIFGATAVTSVDVRFYYSAGSAPGAEAAVRSVPAAQIGGLAGGSFTLPMNPPVMLATNATYWLSVQAVGVAPPGGQWVWMEQTVKAGSGADWQNPGNGFGTGCTAWTALSSCIANTGPDLAFRLSGAPTGMFQVFLPLVRR